MKARTATIKRSTKETQIQANLNLDGSGKIDVRTTIPFFDHMLISMAKHAGFDLTLKARGDTKMDDHHTVEDVGLVLGAAFLKALGEKKGIQRFASAAVPMDRVRVQAALDISGRPCLGFEVSFKPAKIKAFDLELLEDFFKAFTDEARVTLHVWQDVGGNSHHVAEAAFKAVAVVLRQAVAINPKVKGIPSTKGSL